MLIGVVNCDNESIEYCINDRGSKCAKSAFIHDTNYCKQLELYDIVTVKYDASCAMIEFGVNDQFYGVAFENVQNGRYQLMISIRLCSFQPNVELLDHHWTAK